MTEDFEDFFSENTHWVADQGGAAAHEPPQPPKSRKDMRRRRAQRKRRTVTVVVAVVVVIVVVAVGALFGYRGLRSWVAARQAANAAAAIQDYPGPGSGSVAFTVENGQGAVQVAQNLVDQDIVKSQAAFTSAVAAADATLYPGTYQLKQQMKAADVVTVLSDQTKAGGFLEVKPGERVSAVIANVAKIDGADADAFKTLLTGDGSDILPSEAGGSFEGWLEPGMYNVQNRTAADVVKEMVDARVAKLDDMGVPSGSEREDILNIASIAEAEVNAEEYYGKVTRVIDNRIKQGMTLGMDSTVAYGNDVEPSMITQDMLDDASNPYNTRQNTGLPPTPISNPGDSAIKAALKPENGDWLFFVTVNLKTGETKFTTGTLEEQQEQFEQYVAEYKNNNENAN